MKHDPAQALLAAAGKWIQNIVEANAADFTGSAPGEAVSVRLVDVGGERPRIELFVGATLVGHTELLRSNPSAAN